jgi:acyl-CoA hydrolase
MEVKKYITSHLVKSEDLNHHGTLFAGRQAEWFVESGFIAAASLVPPKNIVCLKIHGMTFTRPVHLGEIATYTSRIVLTGKSRMVAHICLVAGDQEVVRGFITFINVDQGVNPMPHGITIVPTDPEDIALAEEAKTLK